MKKTEVLIKIQNFENAVNRLKEAIDKVEDDLDKDGAIQRFEFTVELLWKTLKVILEFHGIDCNSPRNCIKEAFKNNLISDDEIILDMLEDRKKSSHIYNEQMSNEIYNRIEKIYLPYLLNLNFQEKV
ncbi:MAG: nucleotidyltransferase [Leptospiraceae bacterium]|nr:MAG: nucleotidyltransferase [Leptospiraceae bacterium]